MKKWLSLALGIALLAAGSYIAQGVTVPNTTCSEPALIQDCLNRMTQSVNTQMSNTPAWGTPRNFLDNGAMQVQQRGTGTKTCALNGAAITTAAYAADRWGCEVNVAVGAGQLTVITATPSPPPGFQASMKLVRNSGALTQPQCTYQEIPTYKAVQLQGQQVTFSAYIQALAGLAADQGTATQTANLVIITGTGTDEGFGTWTASPAITPAFTGVATAVNQSVALPATPAWARYTATAPIPVTATEIAVAICFTPTATGAGTTDGIAFTGMQLEQGAVATPYEFKSPAAELLEAQRYFQILTEPAAGVQVAITGTAASATVCTASYQFPVQFRAAPTFTALGTALANTTWKILEGAVNNALATTFIVTNTANTVSNASLTITSSGMTAGTACTLQGAGGGSILSWSADF